MSEATETLLVDRREGALRVTLNRPDRLNAFNEEMSLALIALLDEVPFDDSIRVVLLTGAGRGFCAGQDLGDRDPASQAGPLDLGATIERCYNPIIKRIRDLDKPVVCAVNGVAAGAGVNLALACDMVFAARSAKFIQAFAKIGLVPDSGGTFFLPQLLGEARAKALALTGAPLTADQAEAWGMIWKAVDDAALMAEVDAQVAALAQGPTVAYGLIKKAIQAAHGNDLTTQLEVERGSQRTAGRTPDYAEGVRAFLEKRPPVFEGRTR
jgi:2-(1,2-epoxy-1,2-dihydrophenyl)acetyl-CoA isomerase